MTSVVVAPPTVPMRGLVVVVGSVGLASVIVVVTLRLVELVLLAVDATVEAELRVAAIDDLCAER